MSSGMALKKIFIAVLLSFLAVISLYGGELERLARDLDYLEDHYWTAAALPENSVMRSNFARRLRNFNSDVSALYRKLYQLKIPGLPNLVMSSQQLHTVFFSVRSINLPNDRIVLKGTGMGEYRRIFLRNQRYSRKSRKGSELPSGPTLRNVNQTSYNMWVENICRDNAQKLKRIGQRRKKSGARTSNSGLRQNFDNYALAVAGLRAGFVSLAQNKYYKEK